MNVLIIGGLGFVGRHVTGCFLDRGDRVTVVGYRPVQDVFENRHVEYISADTTVRGVWLDPVADADLIVNLAGKTINERWTRKYKQQIYDSRILTTRNLVEAMPARREQVLVSASATGYYGDGGDAILAEGAPHGNDFLAQVSKDWEAEALQAETKGARVVTARFGIILGRHGGILKQMIPAYKLFLGGPLGSGRQWFPWMHMHDLVAALLFVVDQETIQRAVNFCSPAPVQQAAFAKTLGKVLHRPAFLRAPALMLRLALGEFGTAILCSQRAMPDKLTRHGFRFTYAHIETAIENLVLA
jgi:uncharacterized protein (TIGR01777 family)